jgi:hypothetical protein
MLQLVCLKLNRFRGIAKLLNTKTVAADLSV